MMKPADAQLASERLGQLVPLRRIDELEARFEADERRSVTADVLKDPHDLVVDAGVAMNGEGLDLLVEADLRVSQEIHVAERVPHERLELGKTMGARLGSLTVRRGAVQRDESRII